MAHIGFNFVKKEKELLKNIDNTFFYFAHSFQNKSRKKNLRKFLYVIME